MTHFKIALPYLLAGLFFSLSSCSHGTQKPTSSPIVKANAAHAEAALARLDLNLIEAAADDKSAVVSQQMSASPEQGTICHVKFGERPSEDTVKCITAFPLKGVVAISPTGRWFVAAVGDDIWIYDTTTMTVVHNAKLDERHETVITPVHFRSDDSTVAYLDSFGKMVIVDLNIDAKYEFPNRHSSPRLRTQPDYDWGRIQWIGNDRILTYSKTAAPQIHLLAIDNSIRSISLDSAETKWNGVRIRVLPGEKTLLVADAAGFVGEFDALTGKQLFTYRTASQTRYSNAEVQLTNADRFLVTLADDDRLDAAVFTFNTPGAIWTRKVNRGFNAELSNDGQRLGYVWETLSFETGASWFSKLVELDKHTEEPIPGVFLGWSNEAWFAHEAEMTLRDRNGVIFHRSLQWAPWFDPVRGTHTAWFGGAANFMRIRDGEKAPLEFDIAGTVDEPRLRVKGDPR